MDKTNKKMSIIPLFFSTVIIILFGVLGISGVRMNMTKEFNFCINEITALQNKHRLITKKLLSLNKPAAILRIKRNVAEATYIAAPTHLKPPLKIIIEIIKAKQKTLRLIQKSALASAHLFSKITSQKLRLKKYFLTFKANNLALKKTHIKSDSPSYKLKSNYTNLKRIIGKKRLNLTKGFPKILKKLFKHTSTNKTFLCGATILNKNGKPWKIKLLLD